MLENRWEKLYGDREKILAFHREPYLAAVAPMIAEAIKVSGKPTKILVVGGGRGHFSTDVLPRVKKILQEQGDHHPIDVLETDLMDEIKKAPGESKVVDILQLSTAFKAGQFNLVVGESVIHQLHPHIAEALGQIKHVLAPGGIFLHIQDTLPDIGTWVSRQTLRKYGITEVTPTFHTDDFHDLTEISKEAHGNLEEELKTCALRNGLHMTKIQVTRQTVADSEKTGNHPTLDMKNRNGVVYDNGNVFGGSADELPPGKIIIGYRGIITLFLKQK